MLHVQKLLFSSALLMSVFAMAQEKESTDEPIATELDPVTVSSSLSSLLSSKTGRNIVVIKGEQFAKLPVNSIDELLRYVPGIEVQARGPMGSQSDIVLRGGTFQQVLVMHDMLGINTEFKPRFLRQYLNIHEQATKAVQQYIADVKNNDFPSEAESY